MNANVTKMNRGKLLAAVMVFAMIFAGAAIVMSDNEVSAVDGGVTVPDENNMMPLSQSIIAVYEELPIEGEAYIPKDGENAGVLTIPADKTLRIMSGGALYLNGGTINVLGTLIIENGASVYGNGTIVLTRAGTFENAGVLGATHVDGETAATTNTSVDITAINNGLGLTYDGKGSVSVSNVSGTTFGFVNTTIQGAQRAEYTLTVSGDLIAEDYDNNNVTVNGARIVDDLYIGQDVNVTIASSEIRSSTTITVDGNLTVESLTMYNGSEITVNGSMTGEVTAVTGDYLASTGEADGANDTTTFSVSAETSNYTVSGYTLSVGTTSYQKENDEGVNEAWIAQRMYTSGTVNFVAGIGATDTNPTGTMTFNVSEGATYGPVVAAETQFSIPTGMKVVNTGAPFQALGTIIVNGVNTTTIEYAGAYYAIQTTGTPVTNTVYITTFDAAMDNIATAYRQMVNVMGDLEIDSAYTIAQGQTLNLENADEITVKEGGSLTVEQRGAITGGTGGKTVNVDGVAVIQSPSSTGSITFESATRTTGTTDAGIRYTQYSGLQYALDNAAAGDEISVTGTADIEGNLIIPQGVTVTVEGTGAIIVSGNLTVDTEATLDVIDSTSVKMTGARSTVTVNGTMDITDGYLNYEYTGTDGAKINTALTSAGTFVYQDSDITGKPTVMNGVMYVNDETNKVLTNAEAAIAGAAAMDIAGDVTVYGNVSAGDLNLTVDMIVSDKADANFGTITMADGVSITGAGEISATVSAATGAEGSTSTSSVVLDNVKNLKVSTNYMVDAQNVRTYQLQIDGESYTGTVTVSAGTVTVEKSLTVKETKDGDDTYYAILNIDGTLVVPEGATLTANTARNNAAAVTVDGELVADGIVNITAMDVNGTFTVNYGSEVTVSGSMTVTGDLNISSVENEIEYLSVEGTLNIGEKITTMGGSTTGTVSGYIDIVGDGIVKAYNGASVENAIIEDDGNGATGADSTVFYINGNVYMTVYGNSYAVDDAFLAEEDFNLVGYDMVAVDYNIASVDSWYADAELTEGVTSDRPEAVYTMVDASDVRVTISVGTAISLYVDNIKYTSGQTAVLSVGTHTVTTQVNPGYSGTVSVQFNGQTINGSFTITPEMASAAYSGDITLTATGDITYDAGSVTVDNSDDGMGITDYLLIILVVLVIILAIFVALRMMRS